MNGDGVGVIRNVIVERGLHERNSTSIGFINA